MSVVEKLCIYIITFLVEREMMLNRTYLELSVRQAGRTRKAE